MTDEAIPPRELTNDEERLCTELAIDKDFFLGERIDLSDVLREDPYFLVLPHPLDPMQPVASQLEALEVDGNLRFGNHMAALANAYLIATAFEIPSILIPFHPLVRDEFSIHGVHFSQKSENPTDNKSLARLRGTFFHRHTLGHLFIEKEPALVTFPLFAGALRGVPRFRRGELLQWFSIRFAEEVRRFKRDLTIHIRSGDVFSSNHPHPGYWQPPLSFYLQVISEVRPRQVTLVFEDRGNPVIDKIEQHLIHTGISHRLKGGSVDEAFREILTARTLVVAKGSFSKPMVAIGRNLRSLYSYARPQGYEKLATLNGAKFTLHVAADIERAYEARVSPWRNSEEQREAMVSL